MQSVKLIKKELPPVIKYDGRIFIKTRYNSIHVKTKTTLYEYRTDDDSRKLLVSEKGEFFED